MTRTATATVETLTAEVRCLMIGSRQVTMSVFNQLDWVNPEEVRPFGRVRPTYATGDEVYVVGTRVSDGALVRAEMRAWRKQAQRLVDKDPAYVEAAAEARAWQSTPEDKERAKQARNTAWQRIAAQVLETEPGRLAAMWEDLPLIVLAGLR